MSQSLLCRQLYVQVVTLTEHNKLVPQGFDEQGFKSL